jgi:hypothetical protein
MSNVSSLDLTGFPADTYIGYRFLMQNVADSSAGTIRMKIRQNGVWQVNSNVYSWRVNKSSMENTSAMSASIGNSAYAELSGTLGGSTGASRGHYIDATIISIPSQNYATWHTHVHGYDGSTAYWQYQGYGHMHAGSYEMDGIMFYHSGGTWDNSGGDYVLYGIKKS